MINKAHFFTANTLPHPISPMAAMLTGEEKQRIANLERGIMKLLMTSAMTDNPTLLSSTIESYTIFDHDQGSKPFQVLSQFKDGRGRTPLHFASQNFAVTVLLEIVSLVKSKTELMKVSWRSESEKLSSK